MPELVQVRSRIIFTAVSDRGSSANIFTRDILRLNSERLSLYDTIFFFILANIFDFVLGEVIKIYNRSLTDNQHHHPTNVHYCNTPSNGCVSMWSSGLKKKKLKNKLIAMINRVPIYCLVIARKNNNKPIVCLNITSYRYL